MTRPRIFIASAGESLNVANAIHANLERDADCKVWNQGVMRLSRATTQNLLSQLDNSDFGIFVFNPDDEVSSRGKRQAVARDNVVLELGMFAGRLGVESTFIVTPRGVDMKLPSDLLGLSVADYAADRGDHDLEAALGPACTKIRRELKDFKPPEDLQVSTRVKARMELGVALDPIVRKLAIAADTLGRPRARGKANPPASEAGGIGYGCRDRATGRRPRWLDAFMLLGS